MLDKLFVYGTLLSGEPGSACLAGCHLIDTFEVPGQLYDTKQGYPAAVFDPRSPVKVVGELYLLPKDPASKLRELDQIEGTREGLFRRIQLRHDGESFYCYEASHAIYPLVTEENLIKSGSWRRHSSTARGKPHLFAINLEASGGERFMQTPPHGWRAECHLRGEVPVIVTAPHATRHKRGGRIKYRDKYTGALSIILHSMTACHALYTHWASEIDPNYYEDAPFKERLADITKTYGIGFVLDLHGTLRGSGEEIYPGVGVGREFLLGRHQIIELLDMHLTNNGISRGGEDVFRACLQSTIAKYASKTLGVPAMQLEIGRTLREPEKNPKGFMSLASALSSFINAIGG
jgi:gamma-glutamylcyclotransferase (GGCT)/AIG2-like uncharacterized protein YtfP